MKVFYVSILSISMAAVAGCASHLSKEQCLATNWSAEGQAHGLSGHPLDSLTPLQSDCRRQGVAVNVRAWQEGWRRGARVYCTPSLDAGFSDGQAGRPLAAINGRIPICQEAQVPLSAAQYQRGWQQGIQQFCTFSNGMNFARQGKELPVACPPLLQGRFTAGWRAGQAAFCGQTGNALALGREGKPYPGAICPASLFVAFRAEYDRGVALKDGQQDMQSRLDALNAEIHSLVFRYSLHENTLHEFFLGSNISPEASNAMERVNHLQQQKQVLERRLLDLNTRN